MREPRESTARTRMSHSTLQLLKICPTILAALVLGACESSTHFKGLPKNLPVINLSGSPKTPSHSMSHGDYPFADNGDYKSDWAAEGGQGAGMDYSSWRSSHGGSSSRGRSTSSKKKSGSSKSTSKGGSYAIKSGDSLSTIARKNGTTVAKLKAANGLSGDMIRAGKTLKIPK